MPVMPIYNSKRNINANTSEPLRNEASQSFQSDQQVIGAISEVAQKWSDAHDVMQFSEAKGKYEADVARIQTEASLDPNYKDSDKYYKALEDAKKRNLVGISNKQVSEKLAMDMTFGNQMAWIKIDADFKQKEITANRFNVSQSIEGLHQKKLRASTPGEAAQIDQEVQEILSLNVASGVLSLEEAKKIKDNANNSSAEYAAIVSPDAFISNGAAYYGIKQDKYTELKEEARISKERAKKEQIEAQDKIQQQSEADLVMALAENNVDRLAVPDITKKVINGEISREFGDAYIKVLTSPKHIAAGKTKKAKYSGFAKYAKEMFKAEDKDATRKAIVNMLDGAAEGELDQDELGLLIKTANKAGDKKGWIGGSIDGLLSLGKSRFDFSGEKMVFDFLKNMINGSDPEKARKDAISEEQIRKNPNRTQYVEGETYSLPAGILTCVGYDDSGNPKFKRAK